MAGDLKFILFEQYVKNLLLVKASFDKYKDLPDDSILCPLCMKVLGIECLEGEEPTSITVEHLPPHKLGGVRSLLLCKSCNSLTGRTVDNYLIEHLKVRPFEQGAHNSSVILDGTTIIKSANDEVKGKGVFTRHSDNTWGVDLKINSKETYRKDKLDKVTASDSFQITYKPHVSPKSPFVDLGQLKIAYLYAFKQFGYAFALHDSYDVIRKQILNSEKLLLLSKGVLLNVKHSTGIYFVDQPVEVRCFFIVFDIQHNGTHQRCGVLLNTPDIGGTEFYHWLRLIDDRPFQINCNKVPEKDYYKRADAFSKTYKKGAAFIDIRRLGLYK